MSKDSLTISNDYEEIKYTAEKFKVRPSVVYWIKENLQTNNREFIESEIIKFNSEDAILCSVTHGASELKMSEKLPKIEFLGSDGDQSDSIQED